MEEQQQETGNNSDSDTASPGRVSPASQPSEVGGQLASSLQTGAPISSAVATAAPRAGAIHRRHRGAADWEIMQGLRSGQRCDSRPNKYEGYLLKRRKWPLKGWHKRFFCLDKGMLTYAKSSTDMAKGKFHGSVDLGLSVVSTKSKGRRIDIDAEEFIYHLKVKSQAQFQQWISQLRHHRLYRQHELAFGSRDAPKMTSPVGDDSGSVTVTGGKTHWWPSSLCLYICDRATSKDTSSGQNGSSFSLDRQSVVHHCYRDLTYDYSSLTGSSWQCPSWPQVPNSQDKSTKVEKLSSPGVSHAQHNGAERASVSALNDRNNNLESVTAEQKKCNRKQDGTETSTNARESASEVPTKVPSEPVKMDYAKDATQSSTSQNQKYTTCGIDTDDEAVVFLPAEGCANLTESAHPVMMNEADHFFPTDAVNRGRTRQMIDFFEQASGGKQSSTTGERFFRAHNRSATPAEGSCVIGIRGGGGGIEIGIDTSQDSEPVASVCSTQVSGLDESIQGSFLQCCPPVQSFLSCSGSLYKNSCKKSRLLPPPPPPLHACSGRSRPFQARPILECQKCRTIHYNAGLHSDWTCKASKFQLQSSQPAKEHHSINNPDLRCQSTAFGSGAFHKFGNTLRKVSKELFSKSSEKQGHHCCNVPTFQKTSASRCGSFQQDDYEPGTVCLNDLSLHNGGGRLQFRHHQPILACMDQWQRSRGHGGSQNRKCDCVSSQAYKSARSLPVGSMAPMHVSKEPIVASRADLFPAGSVQVADPVSVEASQHVQGTLNDVLSSDIQQPAKNLKRKAALPAESNVLPKRTHTPRIFLYSKSDCNFIKDPVRFLKANKNKIHDHRSCSEGCRM